jgi:hypothetical protein
LFEHAHSGFNNIDLSLSSFDSFIHFGSFAEFNRLVDNFKEKFRVFGIFNCFYRRDDEPLNLFTEEYIIKKMGKTLDYFRHELFTDFDLTINKVPKIDKTKCVFIFGHVNLFVVRIFINRGDCIVFDQFDEILFYWKFFQNRMEKLHCMVRIHKRSELSQTRIKVL